MPNFRVTLRRDYRKTFEADCASDAAASAEVYDHLYRAISVEPLGEDGNPVGSPIDIFCHCDACGLPIAGDWHSILDERLCDECWHADERDQPRSAIGVVAVLMFAAAIIAGLVYKFGG